MADIFVVGSFVVGMTVRVPRKPVMGESLIGDLFDMGPGGKGTNQAIGAARLGADVQILVCIGDDMFSEIAVGLFSEQGLSADNVKRIPNMNTGVGFVTLMPSGENWIVGHLGANQQLRPEDVDQAEPGIAQSNFVMTQFEVPLETVERAMELGRRNQATTILNPAPAKPVEKELLKNVDILTPNESETRILLGLPPDDPAPTRELSKRLLEFGVKRIVVTQGKQGALIVTEDGCEAIPAIEVTPTDVTGAGDSFNAALAVGLSEGKDLREAVIYATYAGAYTTMHLGVIDGLPTRPELETFIEKNKKDDV